MKKELKFENAPASNAHYSPALITGDTVYISGQLPLDPVTREKCTGNIKEQASQAFKNIETILKQVGGDRNDIVNTTAYISDMALWDELNEAYSEYFGDYKPTRSIIAVSDIHFNFLVEISAIAVINK